MNVIAARLGPLAAATSSLISTVSPGQGLLAAAGSNHPGVALGDLGLGGYAINLLVVVAILVGLGYLAVKFGKGRLALPIGLKARDLRVEDRLPIDPQRSILVVSSGRRRFLVGMTQYSITSLAELDPGPDFEQSLQREVRG